MKETQNFPACFIGHGSPMNAIEDNDYTKSLKDFGQSLVQPDAVLVVSAHWETNGTWVTGMANPKTIHDFFGFPQELFDIEYPAPGQPALAHQISQQSGALKIQVDPDQWGLDHGAWAVLRHIFPDHDVPILQLSLDKTLSMQEHFELGQQLRFLRQQGVLILGSGNIVHNLQKIDWNRDAKPHPWNLDFDQWVADCLENRDFEPLIHSPRASQAGQLSIPTLEHYLPLLYVIGASDPSDRLETVFEGFQNASMSMRSFCFS